ncbi:hypothetical protein RISK_002454 [Rhodopirellula islandica]|uniref:Uncharacterized protein n=1 Tax=Rhodopirellula islandica TaxID=595434 RepID=A0A0J1BGZ1_RHOIS|nr:hypothetical protein [Rhodopirellula islandica]KLU05822.1 hypothetical protein RISK_002454 [Rhodopirellula islandica]
MIAVETKLWITGPESERWFDAVRVMWAADFHPERFASLRELPLRKRNLRTQPTPIAEVVLWAGVPEGILELTRWLGSPAAHAGHRLYIAAGQWSDAERSVLQRFGVRLTVAELTDLIAIQPIVRDWSLRVSQ